MKKYFIAPVAASIVLVLLLLVAIKPEKTTAPVVASMDKRGASADAVKVDPAVAPVQENRATASISEISQIDATNPVYRTSLILLSNRFQRMLEGQPQAKDMPPEKLAQLSSKLALLRISQSVFEATIAAVSQNGKDVEILVPAYQTEGAKLKSEVLDDLVTDVGDASFKRELAFQFSYFGKSPQRIEIKGETMIVEGREIYTFDHEFSALDGGASLRGRSTLTAEQFGRYTPFAGLLPKP